MFKGKRSILLLLLLVLAISLTLIFTACKDVKFEIKFVVDGEVYSTVNTNGNEEISMPKDPVKSGYKFDGWYMDQGTWQKEFTARSLLDNPLSSNVSVYAKFSEAGAVTGTGILMEGFQLLVDDSIGTAYYLRVSNSKIVFDFTQYVTVSPNSTWTLSDDIYGNHVISSKMVELTAGTNLYYILVKDSVGNTKQYIVDIYRKPLYQVTYMTSIYDVYSTELVEEGAYANPPTPTKIGHYVYWWSYDFSQPIYENVTALVIWAPNEYKITYNANGGTVSPTTQTVYYGDDVKYAVPTRAGYTFDGWYDGNTRVYDGTWTYLSNKTLVAHWQANTNQIVYNLDGGTNNSYNPSSYVTGSTVTLRDPSKTGYTFVGWTSNKVSTPIKNIGITATDYGTVTFTAHWTPNTYTVTLDAAGGQCSTTSLSATYGSNVSLPTPTKFGYTFDGWYYNTTKANGNSWNIASNCTLVAHWIPIQYSISYQLNGGTNASSNKTSYTIEDSFTIVEPTKVGYTFIGWTSSDIVEPIKQVSISAGTTGNKSFTANWQANQYTLTFDANGGDCSTSQMTVTFDQSFTLPTPSRVGYTFVSWQLDGCDIINGTWTTANDCTLIANWSANNDTKYTVNHYKQNIENDDYTLFDTQQYTGTSDTNVTPAVETFTGFTSPSAQTVNIDADGTRVVSYYYTRNYYSVSFVLNGGNAINTITQKLESTLNLPDGVRAGFTFGGWFEDYNLSIEFIDTQMPAVDKTVYAWWSEETKPIDLKYSRTSTSVTINGYTGSDSTLWIPSYIGDVAVKTIAASSIHATSITKLVVPDTVTSIGLGAFKGCNAIEDITLPFVGNKATSTGANEIDVFGFIFGYVSSSNSELVNQIGDYYYYIPRSIKTVTITKQTKIPYAAFRNCDFIEHITISKETVEIEAYAFYNCSRISKIVIPITVTRTGNNAFYGCSALTIYCEADSLPYYWNSNWNPSRRPVVWGYKED